MKYIIKTILIAVLIISCNQGTKKIKIKQGKKITHHIKKQHHQKRKS